MDGHDTIGSIVALEHVNTSIPDQQVATLFYVSGLGLTRDPYLMTGLDNMWINVGRNQFHLPTGPAQVLRGHVGVVLPDRAALLRRLGRVQKPLAETRFAFAEQEDHIAVTSPWGNRLRCFEPAPRFGPVQLGIAYVELEVPANSAAGIGRFYREIIDAPAEIIDAPAEIVDGGQGRTARVGIGADQCLLFRETDRPVPDYDGHHIQVYVAGFAALRERLDGLGLVTQDNGPHQYRFTDIIDLDQRRPLFVIEHEIRSLKHPLYARKLVNRNPAQTNMGYVPGADAMGWELAPARGTAAAAVR